MISFDSVCVLVVAVVLNLFCLLMVAYSMAPYLDAIKEIKGLVSAEVSHRLDDVSIYLERFTELDLIATGINAEMYEVAAEPGKVLKLCISKIDGY